MLQLFQAFGGPGRAALGCDPAYSMYPEYARDTFTSWYTTHRKPDFTLDVDHTIDDIDAIQPAMVVLTSPNNPTGTELPMTDLKRILEHCQSAQVAGAHDGVHPIVVVDEAYIEFRQPGHAVGHDAHQRLRQSGREPHHEQGIRVCGSPSGLSGGQRGYCGLPAHRAHAIPSVRRDAGGGAGGLDHRKEQLSQVDHLREIREQTAAWLKEQTYKGQPLEVAPSQSNFLLFGGPFR